MQRPFLGSLLAVVLGLSCTLITNWVSQVFLMCFLINKKDSLLDGSFGTSFYSSLVCRFSHMKMFCMWRLACFGLFFIKLIEWFSSRFFTCSLGMMWDFFNIKCYIFAGLVMMHFLHTLQRFIYVFGGNNTFVCLTFSFLFIRFLAYDEWKVIFDDISCHKHYRYFNLILFYTLAPTLKQSVT